MIFLDENNNIVDHNALEVDEQYLSKKFISENDVVLELGARYGTVSCVINKKLKNKKNQVSVEPDKTVWKCLEENRDRNGCEFHIVNGFISNKKLGLINNSYGSYSVEDEKSEIPSYTLVEIQQKYNLTFNTLVADCEGYLETFLDENPILFTQLTKIIFEADNSENCNYFKIKNELARHGFVDIVQRFQNVYIKI